MSDTLTIELTREELETLAMQSGYAVIRKKARAALASHDAESWERLMDLPWRVGGSRSADVFTASGYFWECWTPTHDNVDYAAFSARARLMASAPELAKALAEWLDVYARSDVPRISGALKAARAALRAAGYPGYDKDGGR